MTLHPKHIANLSGLKPFDRYNYFIRKVADGEELWTIVDANDDLGISVIEDDNNTYKTLVPFWPEKDFIEDFLTDNWVKHTPVKISLDDFEDKIIAIIEEENYLINVFPVNNKTGFVVTLQELIRDLNEELEQYE